MTVSCAMASLPARHLSRHCGSDSGQRALFLVTSFGQTKEVTKNTYGESPPNVYLLIEFNSLKRSDKTFFKWF
jgi:hypothetical protein